MLNPTRFVWFDGELVPWDQANVHVLSHGLHYGSGVFEGIRAYATSRGPAVFRLSDHMRRLEASARAYGIPLLWTAAEFTKAALELVRQVGGVLPAPHRVLRHRVDRSNHASRPPSSLEWAVYLALGPREGGESEGLSWRCIDRLVHLSAKGATA
jgi:branched-subunit amino acid aminotransferase/4-amino-4-deoxychorismate lyase